MRKDELIQKLARGLARLGWPTKHIKRITQEVGDHWDDLEAEAREGGLDSVVASRFVNERIGTPEALIRLHQNAMREVHWCSRHPVLTFALLPPVALVLWFLAWAAMAVGASEVYGKLLTLSQPVWKSYIVVLLGAKVIHYTGVFAVPALFWWWARRSFCGLKWSWIACVACALHGLLHHITVRAHSLHWGYGLASPDWVPVLAPLIVAAVAHGQCKWRLVLPLILAGFLAGCASSKVPQQRGWIGGEYKPASRLKCGDAKGLLITALAMNTPAARSGLREGDLIVRVAGKEISKLPAFQEVIDAAQPGSKVPMSVLRDGSALDLEVRAGRETFTPTRALVMGLLLSRELDLLPNPEFSLVALGYQRQERRLELDSAESRFKLSAQEARGESKGLRSSEGWEIWLPIVSLSSRKRIVSQALGE